MPANMRIELTNASAAFSNFWPQRRQPAKLSHFSTSLRFSEALAMTLSSLRGSRGPYLFSLLTPLFSYAWTFPHCLEAHAPAASGFRIGVNVHKVNVGFVLMTICAEILNVALLIRTAERLRDDMVSVQASFSATALAYSDLTTTVLPDHMMPLRRSAPPRRISGAEENS